MRLGSLLFAACLAGAIGCDAPQPGPANSTASLTLGGAAADGSFTALTDGETVSLVPGAQGGFHVWMNWRLDGAPAGDATLERTAHRVSDDAIVLRVTGDVTLANDSDASDGPIPMFMCPTPIGISVLGEPIIYRLTFRDGSAAEIAHQEVTLVPRCPDDDLKFCQQICTG
jgi:hypothetical protein